MTCDSVSHGNYIKYRYGIRFRRWLQDISKRKLADVSIFFGTPPLPVSPGLPEVDPPIYKNKRPGYKKIGLIETFSRVYPVKGEHAPGKSKNRRFHAKSTSFVFTVSCSQLRSEERPRSARTNNGTRSLLSRCIICIYNRYIWFSFLERVEAATYAKQKRNQVPLYSVYHLYM